MPSTDVETALPKEAGESSPQATKKLASAPPAQSSKRLALWAIAAVLILIALVVGITVPLVRDDDDSGDETGNSTTPTESPVDDDVFNRTQLPTFSVFSAKPLAAFDSQVLARYESEDEFAEDVANAARLLLDRVVARNIGKSGYENVGFGGAVLDTAVPNMPAPAAPDRDDTDLDGAPSEKEVLEENDSDYGTNNQEEGVEEGDRVVANADVLYAAYGDYVIAWSTATGEELVKIALPPNQDEIPTKPEVPPDDEPIVGIPPEEIPDTPPEDDPVDLNSDPPTRRQLKNAENKRSLIWRGYSKPWVHAMLLMDTKLIVVAGGYGSQYMYPLDSVIQNKLDTRVLIYDIAAVGNPGFDASVEMTPILTKSLNGYFVSVRAIDDNVHIVTSSSLSYYNQLIEPIEKFANPDLAEMSDDEYIATVVQRANEKYIPNFVSILMEDLRVDGSLPSMIRLNAFDEGDGLDLAPWVYPDGYLNTFLQVASFSTASVTGGRRMTETQELAGLSLSGAILPAYGPIVYSAQDTMMIATSGNGFSQVRQGMVQKTYLMSFKLIGATSEPYTVGSFLGHIINQYSMDVLGNVLRIATTLRKTWFWGFPEVSEPDFADEISSVGSSGADSAEAESDIGVRHLNMEPEVWEESTTENYVVTVDIDGTDHDNNSTTPSVMTQLDIIRIGKENEEITGVRFYDEFAYAVTFQRIDPFYKLRVSDPYNIEILAEVEITGFSRYLHSIDENDEVILAIGQEADENGIILGLQISVFDMRDNTNNPPVVRYLLEADPNTWSSSEGLWDFKANRYSNGRLFLPVNMYTYPSGDEFNGVKVFHVSETDIWEEENCSINFSSETGVAVDYYCASLDPRAMIFNGNMVAMKNHYISSVNLNTCGINWETSILLDSSSCYLF